MQGFGIILIIKCLDIKSLILWSFMYATMHQGNYYLFSTSTHIDHHKKPTTNYGVDTMDIIFNSKYDMNDLEYHNHVAINLILITYIIVMMTGREQRE